MPILKKHDLTRHDVFELMQGLLKEPHWLEDYICNRGNVGLRELLRDFLKIYLSFRFSQL